MPVSQPAASSTTSGANLGAKCDECGGISSGDTVYLPGFGTFHRSCTALCPCSWAWPRSLVDTGEVIFYCGTCALAAGRDELL